MTELLAGLDAYPAYYAHMGPANAAGPDLIDLSPPAVADAAKLAARIAAGEWVVDLRSRRAFAAGHVAGSLSFEHGSDFTNYLGWLIPWATPLTLLGDSAAQVAAAQRDLARIGIDRLARAATGAPAGLGRRPAASVVPRRDLRRAGRGPPPSARGRPGRAAQAGMGGWPRGGCAAYPAPGPARPARRGPPGRDLGALPFGVPGRHRGVPAPGGRAPGRGRGRRPRPGWSRGPAAGDRTARGRRMNGRTRGAGRARASASARHLIYPAGYS